MKKEKKTEVAVSMPLCLIPVRVILCLFLGPVLLEPLSAGEACDAAPLSN